MSSFQFLLQCSVEARVTAIGVKRWREDVPKAKTDGERNVERTYREKVEAKLGHYEAAYQKLVESIIALELAIWKAKMNESSVASLEERESCSKKQRGDDAELRKQCRISCGSDIIIRNVVPYLLHLADF